MKLPFARRERTATEIGPGGEMTLIGHLTELRTRLIRSVLAVTVAAVAVYALFDPIFNIIQEPYCEYQASELRECTFQVLAPLEPFNVRLTMAGYGGLILATPVVLYQLGRFVLPGLYPHEKKALIPFIVLSVVLMVAGMLTAYWLMPRALGVLEGFGVGTFEAEFRPSEYIGFFVKMLFAFGVASELPLVLIFLQKIGIVKPDTLARNRRIAVVAVVILGAVITPTGDPFTLAVISIPMYVFYEIAILVGRRLTPLGSGLGASSASSAASG